MLCQEGLSSYNPTPLLKLGLSSVVPPTPLLASPQPNVVPPNPLLPSLQPHVVCQSPCQMGPLAGFRLCGVNSFTLLLLLLV